MILKQMTDPAQPRGRVQREKVEELEAGKPIGRIELVVLRRYPRRLVNSKSYTGPLAAACGRDETGLVGIVLWGDDVAKVRTGDIIRIEDGWCRRRDGELVVSTVAQDALPSSIVESSALSKDKEGEFVAGLH